MEQLYIDGKPITYEKSVLYCGEEAEIYKYRESELVKIFHDFRRANIPPVNPNMYQYLTTIEAPTFYLPRAIVTNLEGECKGYTMLEFKNPEICSHAQKESIYKIIPAIERIEQDVETVSKFGIKIIDMKMDHILYNAQSHVLGIIDCGIYQKSSSKSLLIENLKEVNYYLRQALLWANYEGTKNEMIGIDFPEIYDTLDEGTMKLSDVLKEEIPKYRVDTLEALKHEYQKVRFY